MSGRARLGVGGLMVRMRCIKLGLGEESWAARGKLTELSATVTKQ